MRRGLPGTASLRVAAAALCLVAAGCTGGGSPEADETTSTPPPTPPTATGECSTFTIAYDRSNGYEASAFIVGALAETELGCQVRYVETTSRRAWSLVARGGADVYMDAYGNEDLRERLAGERGPVTVVGPNGIRGGVDMLAPYFMGESGLDNIRDLANPIQIGWGSTTPAITTVAELRPIAVAIIEFLDLDYVIRDYESVGVGTGIGDLLQQPKLDDANRQPNLYLAEGPLLLLGDGAGRQVVEVPGSSANECEPDRQTTVCSLDDFNYLKIVNSDFARSDSPAYRLVYQYRLNREEAANVLEIVELSGYDVRPADVAAWINTHEQEWMPWVT